MDIILCKTKKAITIDQLLNMIHVDNNGHSIFKPNDELVEGNEINLSSLVGSFLPVAITDLDITFSVSIKLNIDSFDPFIIKSDTVLIKSD